MSASAKWEATRYEFSDPGSSALLTVRQMSAQQWAWRVDGVGLAPRDGVGTAASSSAAKGAARKALAAHLAKAVRS